MHVNNTGVNEMSKNNKNPAKPFALLMLDDCLDRLQTIGKRQPLPTQHFYVEASEIVKESIIAAYQAGVEDGKQGKETFPLEDYSKKS